MKFFSKASLPPDETDRLKALESYDIIESGQDQRFDELAELASYICKTPIGKITFIEKARQYDKSSVGLSGNPLPREKSICQYTLLQNDILEVEDLSASEIFRDNPMVKEDPHFRFYAGMPLCTPGGHNIGTLCVFDTKPNQLNSNQKEALRILARQVMNLLEIRMLNANFQEKVEDLFDEKMLDTKKRLTNKELEASQLQRSIDKANATVKLDLDGKILSANKLFCDLLDYEPDELIEKDYKVLVPGFKMKNILKEYSGKSKEGVYQKEKFKTNSINAAEKWVESHYNPIFDYQGNLVSVLNIAHDITNQVQHQKDLEEAKLEAEKALVTKDNFLSNMSHEIRTPLNAIIGFSDILKKENLNHTQFDHVDTISKAGENLLSIINDILDLSKIESGKFLLDHSPFNPGKVLKTLYQVQNDKASEKNITLKNEIDDSLPQLVLGDEFRFSQIIINLVNNAIKFTHEGYVKVSASADILDDSNCILKIKVQDSGIGIPEDKQEMIFERFTHADTTTSQKFGGTGLGLNIVKLLVENFNGSLSLESKTGQGSTFSVSLPFGIEHELEEVKQEAIPTHKFIQGKILLFEDNPLNQKLVRKIISDLGHELTIVSNGLEGVNWLKNNKAVDLILMDLRMPEMDGFQATSIIRNELKLNIPIIAMSAHSLAQGKTKCIEYGMNDFLSKPFKLDDLNLKIQTALHGKKPLISLTSGSSEQSPDKLYDLKELELLASDNKEFIKEMLEVFITETPEELLSIQNGILQKDYETIYQTSHKLKSSYDVIGYKNVILLKQIEKMSKNEDAMEEIETAFKKLKSETADIIKDMSEELS
ncbi:ATP-binding protein [Psychroflexus sediminis]|uniref:histidine kinase n=1 Tax=Psychroflexus sediminis TaxID=470826 RepID=A0A1G7XCR2_9FLAO|nr:ATP-binding protein [Psychroflexus sediminis]SDG81891.1 PAS domain S-box-containing protein [Psychroflexus sediminis]